MKKSLFVLRFVVGLFYFCDFLLVWLSFFWTNAYSVPRQPLSPPRLTHHEMNICHQFIVEHHRVSEDRRGEKYV